MTIDEEHEFPPLDPVHKSARRDSTTTEVTSDAERKAHLGAVAAGHTLVDAELRLLPAARLAAVGSALLVHATPSAVLDW